MTTNNLFKNKDVEQIKNKKNNIEQLIRIFKLQRRLLNCNESKSHILRGMTEHNNYVYWMLISIQYDEEYVRHGSRCIPFIPELCNYNHYGKRCGFL